VSDAKKKQIISSFTHALTKDNDLDKVIPIYKETIEEFMSNYKEVWKNSAVKG
jgi:hypothetical protein